MRGEPVRIGERVSPLHPEILTGSPLLARSPYVLGD